MSRRLKLVSGSTTHFEDGTYRWVSVNLFSLGCGSFVSASDAIRILITDDMYIDKFMSAEDLPVQSAGAICVENCSDPANKFTETNKDVGERRSVAKEAALHGPYYLKFIGVPSFSRCDAAEAREFFQTWLKEGGGTSRAKASIATALELVDQVFGNAPEIFHLQGLAQESWHPGGHVLIDFDEYIAVDVARELIWLVVAGFD